MEKTTSYKLLVNLSGTVAAQLESEMDYALSQFGPASFSGIKPELVLARFEAKEAQEDTLLRWLHRITGQQQSFRILFNNYGSMPGYPLYVRLQDPAPFHSFLEKLQVIERLLEQQDSRGLFIYFHPRLAFSQSIHREQEMEILLDFSGRSFYAEMMMEELLLVKTPAVGGKNEVVSRLMLSPLGLKRTEVNYSI